MIFDPQNPKPGVYPDIPINIYHGPSMAHIVSHSYLSRLASCPAKAKVPVKVTPAMIFGRVLHKWALEGEHAFDTDCAVMPDFPAPEGQNQRGWHNTNAYKALRDQFYADHEGMDIISEEDFHTIKEMKVAMALNPNVKQLFDDGAKEVSIVWQDKETGIWCKARPDGICPKTCSIIDLKKVSEGGAGKHAFQTIINKRTYHMQMMMCLEGLGHLHNMGIVQEKYDIATLIGVEDVPPYQTEDETLTTNFLQHGFDMFHRLLDIEKACREQNFWPNYRPTNLHNLRQKAPGEMEIPGYLSTPAWENMPSEM